MVPDSLHGFFKDSIDTCIANSYSTGDENSEVEQIAHYLGATPSYSYMKAPYFEDLKKNSSLPLQSLQ